jgi:hypothetical protein
MSPRLLEAAHSGEGQLLAVFSFPEHEKFSSKIQYVSNQFCILKEDSMHLGGSNERKNRKK